ncbi:uncharacterized protein LOC143555741 [Bidens hawaiensis]|uniref:uncharacterized protein LOC143555741 n=1 Tax=Bidens hawaiensis TaxID=980011 RepID=UPI00404A5E29
MEHFLEASGRVKFLIVAIDYFTKWVEAKPAASIMASSVKKFLWEFIICRFGLPQELVSDNGTQFADSGLQEWLKELQVTQIFTLTYGTEAMIPAEIGFPSAQILMINDNDKELRMKLNLHEERRELALIREHNYKRQLQIYYDSRVQKCTFDAGDFVFCNNEASGQEPPGKLAPTREGPYKTKEVLSKGAYKLEKLDGTKFPEPGMWHN